MTGHFISLVERLIIGKPIAFYRRYDAAYYNKGLETTLQRR